MTKEEKEETKDMPALKALAYLLEKDRKEAKKAEVEFKLLLDKGLTYRTETGLSRWTGRGREYLKSYGYDPDKTTPAHWVKQILSPILPEEKNSPGSIKNQG